MTFPGVSGPFQRGNETDLTYRLKWAAWEWLYKEAGCAFKQALADYRRLERKEVAYKLPVAASPSFTTHGLWGSSPAATQSR